MANSGPSKNILAWVIGVIIVIIVDIYIGYVFYATKCEAPGLAQVMVLVVLPAVYLVLMYLTLKNNRNGT